MCEGMFVELVDKCVDERLDECVNKCINERMLGGVFA